MKCSSLSSYEYQTQFTLDEDEKIYCVNEYSDGFYCEIDSDAEWVSISKLPQQTQLTTCVDIGSTHLHALLLSSSKLMPEKQELILKAKKSGFFRLPYLYVKQLDIKHSEVCIKEEKHINIEVCQEILLEKHKSDQKLDNFVRFPDVIYPDMEIPVLIEKFEHCLYGGLFSDIQTLRVQNINNSNQLKPYIFDRDRTKVTYIDTNSKLNSRNAYKNFTKNPRVFSKCSSLKEPIHFITSLCKMNSNLPTGVLIKSTRGCGKRAIVRKSASKCGFNFKETSLFDIANIPALTRILEEAKSVVPCVLHIRQFADALNLMTFGQKEILNKVKDIFDDLFTETTLGTLIIILSSSNIQNIPGPLRNLFLKLEVTPPSENDRKFIVSALSDALNLDLDVNYISK